MDEVAGHLVARPVVREKAKPSDLLHLRKVGAMELATAAGGRRLRGDIDQWDRPGGEAGRSRDLQQLRPRGMPDDLGDGVTLHRLEDGRQAVLRPSTSPGSNGVATLEIQEPFRGGFTATDKFRYPVGR